MQIMISTTAYSTGYGSNRHRHAAGFTATERAAIRNGDVVVYQDVRLSGGNHGTYLRQGTWTKQYGYDRRVPNAEVIAEYNRIAR